MMKETKGICFLHSETGTEGGWWAIQEDGFVGADGHWSYEGLNYLEEGDDFTVYAKDGSVLWHGIIHQDTKTGAIPHRVIRKGKAVIDNSWKQQVVGSIWVHWIQKGMDPAAWGELFCGEKRCLLKREETAANDALLERQRRQPALNAARGTRKSSTKGSKRAGRPDSAGT